MARQVAKLTLLLKKRTDPSQKEACTPPGCLLRAANDWAPVASLPPIRLQPGIPFKALTGGQTRATSSGTGELGVNHASNVCPPNDVLKSLSGPPQLGPVSPTVMISAIMS